MRLIRMTLNIIIGHSDDYSTTSETNKTFRKQKNNNWTLIQNESDENNWAPRRLPKFLVLFHCKTASETANEARKNSKFKDDATK